MIARTPLNVMFTRTWLVFLYSEIVKDFLPTNFKVKEKIGGRVRRVLAY